MPHLNAPLTALSTESKSFVRGNDSKGYVCLTFPLLGSADLVRDQAHSHEADLIGELVGPAQTPKSRPSKLIGTV